MIIYFVVIILILLYIFQKSRKLKNKPFQNVWTDKDKNNCLEMMTELFSFFDKNNIPYFLYYGTLLGGVRNGGFIPWDDDIDIIIEKKHFDNLDKFNFDTLILKNHSQNLKKICKKNNKNIWGKNWSWPFIDIFPYFIEQNNAFYTLDNDNKKYTFVYNDFFPIKKKVFEKEYLFSFPNHSEKILDTLYNNWRLICKSSSYNHKLEKHNKNIQTTFCNEIQTIDNSIFENVYVINLDKRKERWNKTFTNLTKIGIFPKRFSAIDKDTLTYENLYITQGEIACSLSHIKLWKEFASSSFKYILIFEDDVIIHTKITKENILNYIKNITEFDIIYLGYCYPDKHIKNNIGLGGALCCHAYILSKEGVHKLLSLPYMFDKPIDNFLRDEIRKKNIKSYLVEDISRGKYSDKGIIYQDEKLKSDLKDGRNERLKNNPLDLLKIL